MALLPFLEIVVMLAIFFVRESIENVIQSYLATASASSLRTHSTSPVRAQVLTDMDFT